MNSVKGGSVCLAEDLHFIGQVGDLVLELKVVGLQGGLGSKALHEFGLGILVVIDLLLLDMRSNANKNLH